MAELKPCPFCGGKAETKIGVFGICAVSYNNCGAMVTFLENESKNKAVECWNRRTSNDKR